MSRIRLLLSALTLTALMAAAPMPAAAADFQWQDAKGATHSLDEYKGRPIMLHFWATWCPPCRAELPELDAWKKAHPDIAILPVALDEQPDVAAAYLKSRGISLPANQGDTGAAMQLGVRGLPSTFIIAANGKIEQRYIGAQSWSNQAFSAMMLDKLRP